MKALVGAFNQEKALVGAFSVIVQPVVEPMDRFTALVQTDGLTLTGWPGSLGSTGLATTSRMQSWPAARRMEATWHGGTQLSLSF